MRTAHRLALAFGVICLGGAAGFFAARMLRHTGSYAVENSPGRAAAPRAPAPRAASPDDSADEPRPPQPHAVPATLPDLTLPDLQGSKRSLSDWKGHPLLVNFWATWCEPCRREIPLLERLRHERAAEGIEVVGIAVDFRDAVQRYAREMRIDYPVLIGEQDGLSAISAFGMDTVFPFTIFADKQGRILTLKVGELHQDEAAFILDRLREVDAGRLDLGAARREVADGVANLAAQRARAEATAAPRSAPNRPPASAAGASISDRSAPNGPQTH